MANFTRDGFSKLLLGVGLLLLVGGVVGPYYTAGATQGHETTDGTILSSEVETQLVDQQGGQERRHYPIIEYEYTVDGEQYTNDRLYLQGGCTPDGTVCGTKAYESSVAAVSKANDYPEGETVEVHYDPDTPRTAYLESVRSFPSIEHIIAGGLSIGAIGLGIAGLLGLPIQVILPFDLADPENSR